MSSLFRSAAIRSHRQRLFGDVVLSQPRSLTITSIFLAFSTLSIIAYLATGTYARKETVAGVLAPREGTVRIMAPAAGVIDRLYASEGLIVDKGDALVALRDERLSRNGQWTGQEMASAINAQLSELDVRRNLEERRLLHEKEKLVAEVSGLEAELTSVGQQLEVQRELLANSALVLSRVREVAADGYISEEDLAVRQKNHLTNRQLQAGLQQQSVTIKSRIAQLRLALDRLPIDSEDRLSQIASIEAELRLKLLELDHRGAFTVTAPVAGTVTAIQAIVGAVADPRIPLLTLLPTGSTLEAHLFVPTRAIGFVEVGQKVRLLYDAFDYRRFGTYAGRVSQISTAAFFPAETSSVMRTAEPTYRITVEIAEQAVAAYGRTFALQPGMLLQADIILESRSILAWIFDPLFSLRGRT